MSDIFSLIRYSFPKVDDFWEKITLIFCFSRKKQDVFKYPMGQIAQIHFDTVSQNAFV